MDDLARGMRVLGGVIWCVCATYNVSDSPTTSPTLYNIQGGTAYLRQILPI